MATHQSTRLTAADLPEVIDVMADAFRDYPVMRYVVGPGGDVGARTRRLVELFVTRRLRRGGPMFGVVDRDSGTLAAAAILTLPTEAPPPEDLAPWVDAIWTALGSDAFDRYQQYAASWPVIEATPHHHLNMIGVRRAHAGSGLARALLTTVAALADADQGSSGVSLTTEVARNVPFYEHFGYQVVGHKVVSPTLETWALLRRCP